jgi:succinate dehydrogenase / fumarate reductase cytochrome b subunit
MKQRPLSPHLQVYNLFFKVSSLTSILYRLTGIAAVLGTIVLVWWLMGIAHGPEAYDRTIATFKSPFGMFIFAGLSWCFWYQVFGGIRHLFWDAGYGFKLSVSKTTGTITIIGSLLMAALTWVYICGVL